MIVDNKTLYDRLLELAVIDEAKLKSAFDLAESQTKDLADIIYDLDLATDEQIGQVMADMYSLPFVKLDEEEISDDLVKIISEVFSKKQGIVVFKKDQNGLSLATFNPSNLTALDFITKKTGLSLKVYFTTKKLVKKFWEDRESKLGTNFETEVEKLIAETSNGSITDTPIISLTDLIINYSEKNHASDIHIEPGENISTIRFRIDSVLHDVATIPIKIHHTVSLFLPFFGTLSENGASEAACIVRHRTQKVHPCQEWRYKN